MLTETSWSEECPDEGVFALMLQGELPAPSRARLERHVDTCPMCAALMIELAQVFFSASDPPLASPPRDDPQDDDEDEDEDVPAHLALPGPREQIAHYTITRLLGRGGMGAVYEAMDARLERRVALKILRADLIEPSMRQDYSKRMWREAKSLAALSHPNILTVHEIGQWRDQVYLVTELIQGQTLRRWLERAQPEWPALLAVFEQAAQGLIAAHDARLIHRDIKPENIMVSDHGRVVVMDFGLARSARELAHEEDQGHDLALDDDQEQPTPRLGPAAAQADKKRRGRDLTLTASGVILGTPAYMSPEQHLGAPVDARADQFAWCVALFEALYGERPFQGKSAHAIMIEACSGRVRPRPADHPSPAAIYQVLCRGLQPRPEDRYPTMRALLEALALAQREPVQVASLILATPDPSSQGAAAPVAPHTSQVSSLQALDAPSQAAPGAALRAPARAWRAKRAQALAGALASCVALGLLVGLGAAPWAKHDPQASPAQAPAQVHSPASGASGTSGVSGALGASGQAMSPQAVPAGSSPGEHAPDVSRAQRRAGRALWRAQATALTVTEALGAASERGPEPGPGVQAQVHAHARGAARAAEDSGRAPDHAQPSSPPQRKPVSRAERRPLQPPSSPSSPSPSSLRPLGMDASDEELRAHYEASMRTKETLERVGSAWDAAHLAKASGRWSECLAMLDQVERHAPASSSYRVALWPVRAECLFELKRCDDAMNALRHYERLTSKPKSMTYWGELQTKLHCPAQP